MIKSWFLSVRDETMAPARMISFMEHHAATCEICLQDPDLKEEFAKITELVLPESKIPKAIRLQDDADDDSDLEDDGLMEKNETTEDDLAVDEEGDDLEDMDQEEDEFLEDGDEDD